MKIIPDFSFEMKSGFEIVAGLDEAGRGPLCGPVVAAAVIFKNHKIPADIKITDSKKLTKKQRELAYDWIISNTIWATGSCSPAEIDEINILWASMLAMTRAIENLPCAPQFCLIDGNRLPKNVTGIAVVKGDSKSISIAAASIIAKITRDKIMDDLSILYPQYDLGKNSGYPTKSHLQAIEKYGINEHYRKTFKPVKNLL